MKYKLINENKTIPVKMRKRIPALFETLKNPDNKTGSTDANNQLVRFAKVKLAANAKKTTIEKK
jgi:hypothetical protein